MQVFLHLRSVDYQKLSRRERQIVEALHELGTGTVADVVDAMQDAPSYNAVRVTLSILERKGFVTHERVDRRYVYRPRQTSQNAQKKALRHLVRTFFSDDASSVVSTLLGSRRLPDDELEALGKLIEDERRKRKKEGKR